MSLSFGNIIGGPLLLAGDAPVALAATAPGPTSPLVPETAAADASTQTASAPVGGIELSELLVDPVAPLTDAADEFIELHNTAVDEVDISGFKLVRANDRFTIPQTLVAPDEYVVFKASQTHISLTNTGGTLSLQSPDGTEIESTEWKSVVAGATWAWVDDAWHWTGTPTMGEPNELKLVGAEAAATTPTPSPTTAPVLNLPGMGSVDISDVTPPIITELLPDPVAPATDAEDEFIELYNGGTEPFDLAGYSLKTGKTLSEKYTFGLTVIEPGQFLSLPSSVSGLGLSNAGSSAALFDANGLQVGPVIAYSAAKAGQSWSLDEDVWGWTSSPTPGAANIMTIATLASATTKTAAPATKKASTSSKTTTTKAAPKAKAAKASKSPKATAKKPLVAGTSNADGGWLLFTLVGLTIAYIIYEFRHDLLGFYRKFRRHPGLSRTPGSRP